MSDSVTIGGNVPPYSLLVLDLFLVDILCHTPNTQQTSGKQHVKWWKHGWLYSAEHFTSAVYFTFYINEVHAIPHGYGVMDNITVLLEFFFHFSTFHSSLPGQSKSVTVACTEHLGWLLCLNDVECLGVAQLPTVRLTCLYVWQV